jgi:ADP-ribose pyrophosphatase
MSEELISKRRIFKGNLLGLRTDKVSLPNKKITIREICEHPGAVAVIPLLGEDIVLIKQYRRAVDEVIYEIPAGLVKKGEEPQQAALRELREETGYQAHKIRKVSEAYASPGYSTEKIEYYLAWDLSKSEQACEEDEVIEVQSVSLKESWDWIKDGRIRDNKTLVGIFLARNLIDATISR